MKPLNILAISVAAVFLILGLIRLYPYESNLQESLKDDPGDDWWTFARYGLDIARNGILMPSVKSSFSRPASFLYPYFLALSFFLFGENAIPIYIMQHLMMGLAVALVYWTFRDKMKRSTGIIFLLTLAIFTLLDVYKNYAVRLLSENLIFFTIPLFFFCFVRGFEKDNFKLQAASAFIMGTVILTRPNTALFGLILIFIVLPFYAKKKRGLLYLSVFAMVMILTVSTLALRNYLVCGRLDFLPVQGPSVLSFALENHPVHVSGSNISPTGADKSVERLIYYMLHKPLPFFGHYAKKALYIFGFLPILSTYKFRPHWIIMWIGYFTYLFLCIKERKKMEMWEVAVHLYLASFYGTLIFFSVITGYGFRYIIPATNFVLIFPFLVLDRLR